MPLFQSRKDSFRDCGFQLLSFPGAQGSKYFILQCDTVLHNQDLGFVCFNAFISIAQGLFQGLWFSTPLLSWCLGEQVFLYYNVRRCCIIMILALFATMPLFQSRKEAFKDCSFQLLSFPGAQRRKYFVFQNKQCVIYDLPRIQQSNTSVRKTKRKEKIATRGRGCGFSLCNVV